MVNFYSSCSVALCPLQSNQIHIGQVYIYTYKLFETLKHMHTCTQCWGRGGEVDELKEQVIITTTEKEEEKGQR